MTRSSLLLATLLAFAPITAAGAQVRLPVQPPVRQLHPPQRATEDSQTVPREYRPPPGMCRIWLDNVAPSQQPAPTDCPTAVRNRPNNGRVLFGDDYVDRRKGKDRERRPEQRPDQRVEMGGEVVSPLAPPAPRFHTVAFGGPYEPPADESLDLDARDDALSGVVSFASAAAAQPRVPRDTIARRGRGRDSTLSERRRAVRERRAADRADDPDDDLDEPDDRADRRGRTADRGGRGYYPPYAPPARANGVCLDRDGDGWCDDVRGGSPYCRDADGDGRCDDYGDLAAAPYASAMPPMSAALDVRRGLGSPLALRWLGTAEVIVRTSELRRTGVPYRAMWLDANTNRLLQVWTDRDGDGLADRVEIYRNGRVAKILGR